MKLLFQFLLLFRQGGLAFVIPQPPNSKTTTARAGIRVQALGKTTARSFQTRGRQFNNNNNNEERSVVHLSALPSKLGSDELLVQNVSHTLNRTSWVSWWGQLILTTVSTVTLFFARSTRMSSDLSGRPAAVGGGFFLAGSVSINLLGMLTTLIGAEQIVGMLATKVLTTQGVTPFGGGGGGVTSQTLQPIDILIVQANTNTLLSHFVSLVCALYLTRSVTLLDPPSVEGRLKKTP